MRNGPRRAWRDARSVTASLSVCLSVCRTGRLNKAAGGFVDCPRPCQRRRRPPSNYIVILVSTEAGGCHGDKPGSGAAGAVARHVTATASPTPTSG